MLVGSINPSALPSSLLLSQSERTFIAHGIAQDVRADGRTRLEYRSFSIDLNPIAQAVGSARVRLGQNNVLVSVKADISVPSFDAPNLGLVSCAVDCAPSFGMDFEERQVIDINNDLSSLLDSILGSSLDLEQLLLTKGQHCWSLWIDVLVLESDGNLVDTILLAVHAALASTKLPAVTIKEGGEATEISLSNDSSLSVSLDIQEMPVAVTLCQIGDSSTSAYLVDPNISEELCARSALVVAIGPRGNILFIKKLSSGYLSPGVLIDMVQTGQMIASTIHGRLGDLFKASLIQANK